MLENPFADDDLSAAWAILECPGVVGRRALNSSCIAARQFGLRNVAHTEVGTGDGVEGADSACNTYLGLGLKTPACALVTM
jgi:hypothetical protein